MLVFSSMVRTLISCQPILLARLLAWRLGV